MERRSILLSPEIWQRLERLAELAGATASRGPRTRQKETNGQAEIFLFLVSSVFVPDAAARAHDRPLDQTAGRVSADYRVNQKLATISRLRGDQQ